VLGGASASRRDFWLDGRRPMIGHELLIGGWTRDGPSRRVIGPDVPFAFPDHGCSSFDSQKKEVRRVQQLRRPEREDEGK